jgi:hypothetical protein
MKKTTKKKPNAPDSTLRNTQASGKKFAQLQREIKALKERVSEIEGEVFARPSNRI